MCFLNAQIKRIRCIPRKRMATFLYYKDKGKRYYEHLGKKKQVSCARNKNPTGLRLFCNIQVPSLNNAQRLVLPKRVVKLSNEQLSNGELWATGFIGPALLTSDQNADNWLAGVRSGCVRRVEWGSWVCRASLGTSSSPPISQEMSFLTLLLYPMFQKKYHVMTT